MGVFLQKEETKVLLLIDGMDIGGAETHLFTLAEALAKKGALVEVMCDGGIYAQMLAERGFSIVRAPFRNRSPRGFFQCARILRLARHRGFTAVHAHTRYTALLATLFLRGIPLVTTVHLDFSTAPLKRLFSRWGRKSLAVSGDLSEYLVREYGFDEKNILLTKNGIDTDTFRFLPVRGRCILHISRLDKDRSLCAHKLCAIAPALHKRFPETVIRIYGDGDDLENLRTAAAAANRQAGCDVVFLMGSTAEVQSALCEGAMLIGVSRAALEGAAVGLPIILAGNDGYGGILTEECYKNHKYDNFCCRNSGSIKEEMLLSDIETLLKSHCLCENLRSKIATLVRRDFSAESMAEDALCAYRAARRTAIVGYYGFGNFGDEMMLKCIRNALHENGEENAVHLGQERSNGALSRKHPIRSALYLRGCDRVYFGGGNLLQSETSARSLFYYGLLLLFCKKEACIGIGMGLGGFRGSFTERLCGMLLSRFRSLNLRTQTDAALALRLAPKMKGRIILTSDPCLHIRPASGRRRGRAILAITRRRPSEAMLDFLKKKREAGATVIFAILFPKEDEAYAETAAAEIGAALRKIRSAEDFFTLAENAALCISERLHGAIFSLLCRIPCLLLSESQKNRAFLRDCRDGAEMLGFHSPVLPFCTAEDAEKKEKEVEENALGFLEIINFFRDRYKAY